jgi:hypothetical protein
MTRNYDIPRYSYKRPQPGWAWVIERGDEGILVLPYDLPELVVGAITAAFQAEADREEDA